MDSLRSFDTETQRSVEKLEKVQIYPATEMILSRHKIGDAVRRMKEEYKKQEEIFKKQKEAKPCYLIFMRKPYPCLNIYRKIHYFFWTNRIVF